ncbi:MAG: diadenylate cyclase CdaA [Oscillospiraceae bacterium]|nr:diadenylate cyclase CdaA [Oscillospiraceae bacterium]
MGDFVFSWDNILNLLRTFGIWDIIDIVIIAYLLYRVLLFAANTRAGQLLKGIAILFVVYLLAAAIDLKSTSYLLEQVFSFGIIAVVVVFQPELRHALESMGKSRISNLTFLNFNTEHVDDETLMKNCISKIVDGVADLSKHDVGALIVFEREVKLGEIISTGTVINAEPSKEIIGNIFFHNAPLHDGATIIRGGRVYASGCFLPLSQNYDISNMLGTRHRAALGMSENSDAVIVVVSEETGTISMALNGELIRELDPVHLKRKLEELLIPEKTEPNKVVKIFGKGGAEDK